MIMAIIIHLNWVLGVLVFCSFALEHIHEETKHEVSSELW
jgi:hypothetical protein